jgi:hypothetical protein
MSVTLLVKLAFDGFEVGIRAATSSIKSSWLSLLIVVLLVAASSSAAVIVVLTILHWPLIGNLPLGSIFSINSVKGLFSEQMLRI